MDCLYISDSLEAFIFIMVGFKKMKNLTSAEITRKLFRLLSFTLYLAFLIGATAALSLQKYHLSQFGIDRAAVRALTRVAPVIGALAAKSKFSDLTQIVLSIYWLFAIFVLIIGVAISLRLIMFTKFSLDKIKTGFFAYSKIQIFKLMLGIFFLVSFALSDLNLIDFISFRTGHGWVDLKDGAFVASMQNSLIPLVVIGYFLSVGISCAYFGLMIYMCLLCKILISKLYHRH